MTLPTMIVAAVILSVTCYCHLYLRERKELALQNAMQEAVVARDRALEAKAMAEEAELQKSRLLSTLGHELRTPMMTIAASAEMLDAVASHPKDQAIAARLKSNTQSVITTMNDVLTLARADASRLSVETESFSVIDLLKTISEIFPPSRRTQQLIFDLPPNTPVSWQADVRLIRQVLMNLIGNALAHSGSPLVRLRVTANEDLGLVFTVEDRGGRLKAEDLDRIFDPYIQIGPDRHGSGLGLAIAKRFAHALGGSLTAEVQNGSLTRFTFVAPATPETGEKCSDCFEKPSGQLLEVRVDDPWLTKCVAPWLELWNNEQISHAATQLDLTTALDSQLHTAPELLLYKLAQKTPPLELSSGSSSEISSAPRHNADWALPASRQLTCLIVDDNEDLGLALSDFLELLGHKTVIAKDGATGIDLGSESAFDLILLDLNIPRLDGFSFLKQRDRLSGCPAVFVITGNMTADQNIVEAGADAVLRKPISLAALADAINERLASESDDKNGD